MANLIDITPSTLCKNTFCFENRNMNTEKISVPIDNPKFGILNFEAITTSETRKEIDFVFTVDCSGSMSDMCSDGRSKMQHISHTLKNMILFIYENNNIKANITINTFDTQFYKIIDRTKITDYNFDLINSKIDKIHPRGSTNIQYALIKSAEAINDITAKYPENIVSHIFMTDGEATDGAKDIEILKGLVIDNVMNSFVGFGIDHDASLLNGICSVGKRAYYFIDKLESAGLVYGEILHSIVYKVLTDAEITVLNGLIYDFKKNEWVENIKIADIVSESNKTYNIISNDPDNFKATIKGTMDDLIILYPSRRIEDADLTKHVFRQMTLQLLFKVNEYCDKKKKSDSERAPIIFKNINSNYDFENSIKKERTELKKALAEFMEEMKKYMTENDLNDDSFMKNLCDDIFISFRTFDTKYGNMYCGARQTSQGTQRVYTVSQTIDEENVNTTLYKCGGSFAPMIPSFTPSSGCRMRRQRAVSPTINRQNNCLDLDDVDDIDTMIMSQHEVTDFASTPYLTPQATQVMNFINSNNVDGEDGDREGEDGDGEDRKSL